MNGRKQRKVVWLGIVGSTTVALLVGGCSMTRAGYESAAYQVVRKSDRIELREYPELSLVSTPMPREGGESDGFMRLFGYISGENEGEEKIAMTTPVFMEEGEKKDRMSFVMPSKVAAAGTPRPSKESVSVTIFAAGRFAVYRLKGSRSEKKVAVAKEALNAWIRESQLESDGPHIIAGYDPPFTPAALQRNEVMVRVHPKADKN